MLELSNQTEILGNKIRWGKSGNGPPLVAIHGTPFSSQVWRRIVPALSMRWTVYYYDLVGYGLSEMREGQDVSLAIQNKVLAALFEEWSVDRPSVLAHDFGAATALRGYYIDGLRYESLTIFDAVAISPWGSPLVQHVRQFETAFAEMPSYMHEAVLRAYLCGSAFRQLSKEALEIYIEPWRGETGQRAFYRQIAQMDRKYTDEVEAEYDMMECPVTVLWGENDQWIPVSKGEELASRLSANRLIRMPDAGHLMQEDAPEAIVAAMLVSLPAGSH